jgi:transcriptional regulator with XRE-family HTH domain
MGIGTNLRKLRDSKKLTQQEVAEKIEVDRKTYASWETGKEIKGTYIQKLADFFDVEVGELFKENASKIVVNQNNTDNKDNSVNGVVVLIDDKEAVSEIVKIIKGKL